MTKKIVFATSNPYKIKEIKAILPPQFDIQGLEDIGCTEDIPETRATIIGNAVQKAEYVFNNYGVNCFAEDTGLEVKSLDGEPGVLSARYAGPGRDAKDNMALVLKKLGKSTHREARFKTVIALIIDGKLKTFEGIVNGQIILEPIGDGGFGYDPIFQPDGFDMTFGQLSSSIKNKISHRAKATEKLMAYLDKKA